MEEEIKTTGGETPTTQALLDQIKELKDNSVSKESYEALVAQNKELINSIVNGQSKDDEQTTRTRDEIKKDLFGAKEELSNLEYAKLAVELDNKVIEETGESVFIPKGKLAEPTSEEFASATRLHNCLVDCIEEAEGDNEKFNQALSRRIRKN